MGRLKLLYILAFILFISCTKHDEFISSDNNGENGDGKDLPVMFLTEVEDRGAVITTATLTDMSVSAYYTGTQTWSQVGSTTAPNRMKNQKVTKSGSVWTTTPTIYWPSSTTEKISFFAYAPYATASNGITYNTVATGAPQITYVTPSALANQPDLLVSSALDKTRTSSATPLNFQHGLVKVNVSAALAVNLGLLVISEIKFNNIYTTATYNFQSGTWGAASTKGSFGLTGLSLTISLTPVSLLGGQFFMFPPQTLGSDASFSIKYSLLGIGYTKNYSLSGAVWSKGQALNYSITL